MQIWVFLRPVLSLNTTEFFNFNSGTPGKSNAALFSSFTRLFVEFFIPDIASPNLSIG